MEDKIDVDGLVRALRSGQQADMDGCMVKVSRQACEVAADRLTEQQAEIDRLTSERDEARASEASLIRSRDHHKSRADSAKGRMGKLRKRQAALMSALRFVVTSDDLTNAKFTASVALGGWEDDEILYRARGLATEAETNALAEIVKKAVDAETRACIEAYQHVIGALTARLDQPKAESGE